MKGFSTKAIHGARQKKDAHGSLRMPVYDSVSFEQESAEDIHQAFAGRKAAHTYSRISNPTVEDLEQRIRLLSDSTAVLAVSSGMAAITNVILALAEAGTNIVTTRHLFGNTLSLFERTLGPWGLEVRYVSMTDPDQIEKAIDGKTRAVFLESITNPQLEVADFATVSTITSRHSIPLVVDNTVTTPYLFKTKDHGINIELLSSTKYISGGATSVGGLIIDNGNFDWSKSPRLQSWAEKLGPFALVGSLRREVYRNVGACLAPHHAYLQSLGLETMDLRIDKSCANALAIAHFLENHEKVKKVNYPGLPSSPFHQLARQQFNNRFGGILTFHLNSQEECFKLMDSVQLIRRSTNVNDNKTLILHPASTIFCEYSQEKNSSNGIPASMIRVSVGIEDINDLQDDLAHGLESL